MKADKDYLYIRAWGRVLQSFEYYIDAQVDRARSENAPQTAIYRNQDGTWSTFEEITNLEVRTQVSQYVSEMQQ